MRPIAAEREVVGRLTAPMQAQRIALVTEGFVWDIAPIAKLCAVHAHDVRLRVLRVDLFAC